MFRFKSYDLEKLNDIEKILKNNSQYTQIVLLSGFRIEKSQMMNQMRNTQISDKSIPVFNFSPGGNTQELLLEKSCELNMTSHTA